MKEIAAWVLSFARGLGGPGLFVVAFLDSSFLSLPEINDILVVWMVTRHKERMLFYASMATLGSITGCFFLYYLGRKGGEAVLRRRFNARSIERGMRLFQRWGLFAVLIPAIMPPPAPFKIFVLMAGVARVRVATFALAVGVGRGLRYFTEGLLAIWYGDAAMDFIHANGRIVAYVVVALVVSGAVAWWLVKRIRLRGLRAEGGGLR